MSSHSYVALHKLRRVVEVTHPLFKRRMKKSPDAHVAVSMPACIHMSAVGKPSHRGGLSYDLVSDCTTREEWIMKVLVFVGNENRLV